MANRRLAVDRKKLLKEKSCNGVRLTSVVEKIKPFSNLTSWRQLLRSARLVPDSASAVKISKASVIREHGMKRRVHDGWGKCAGPPLCSRQICSNALKVLHRIGRSPYTTEMLDLSGNLDNAIVQKRLRKVRNRKRNSPICLIELPINRKILLGMRKHMPG